MNPTQITATIARNEVKKRIEIELDNMFTDLIRRIVPKHTATPMKTPYFLILTFLPFFLQAQTQKANELKRLQVKEAKQGVAVDLQFFYVINNTSITKHSKQNGSLVQSWNDSTGLLKHLNSGLILENRLYCAHSNYPNKPMSSSIEIFDKNTLKHLASHSFGFFPGSATWIDFYGGHWWVAFANYSDKNSDNGRDNRWTTLVKFTTQWQQVAAWGFPENLLQSFAPKSTSGGTWGPDGNLYCTGHDKPEIYVLKIPERGSTLIYIGTIAMPSEGQGFAIDRSQKNGINFWGITRNDNFVIQSSVKK